MGKGILGIPHLPFGPLSAGTCTALGAWLAAMDFKLQGANNGHSVQASC